MTLQSTRLDNWNVEFKDLPVQCFESWVYPGSADNTTNGSLESEKGGFPGQLPQTRNLSQARLQDWLRQKGEFATSGKLNGAKAVCGLRLIIQEIDGFVRNVIPFTAESFKLMTDTMSLPRTFHLYEILNRNPVAYRSRQTPIPNGKRVTIVCQSPNIPETFMTLALSYDPSSNVTTGFLIHAKFHGNQPGIHPMVFVLLKTAHKLPHPMLPAVLFLEYWCDYLRGTLASSMRELIESKKQTGVLDEELKRWNREPTGLSNNATAAVSKQKGLNDVHQSLIVIHNHMMNDVPVFLHDFSASILKHFDEIKDLTHGLGHQQTIENSGQELKEYVLQIQSSSDTLLRQREQRLSQVDLQLKVLYNIMQQINNDNNYLIALENKKDSRAMKTISIVTMIFLPGTAIATIFSMGPFFTSSATSSEFTVSTQFWIYWVVVIPLTVAVLLIWRSWMARAEKKDDVEGARKRD